MEDEIDTPLKAVRLGVLGGDGIWSVAEVLRASGCAVADLEPAPKQVAEAVARKWHYGRASVRAGLLGHPRAILQLFQQVGGARPKGWVWMQGGLAIDGFRSEVDPEGMAVEAIEPYRMAHLAALARLPFEVDRLILPLCTDRAWVDGTGTVFGAPRGDARLTEIRFTAAEMQADLVALLALLRATNPGLVVQIAILPSLMAQPDPVATEITLRALQGAGAQHDAVFDALLVRRAEGGSGAAALAHLAQGLDLDTLAASVAAPAAPVESPEDRDARRKARREKRKSKGDDAPRNRGSVVCEDELLEAFAK